MKRIAVFLCVLNFTINGEAQSFNNEWIDYNKTYFKFKIGVTGVYQIVQPALASIGLGNTAAEHFQLWRNGQQVALYTSVSSGPLGSSGFLEFWGENNDGKPDNQLYRDASFQLSNKHSLQTDTAAFFLTINTTAPNLRILNTSNNVSGNVLSPEPYFIHKEGNYFKHHINPGFFADAGQRVYSSSYDKAEGWVAADINAGQNLTSSHSVYLFASGPAATFSMNISGNALNPRRFRVKLNTDSIWGQQLDYLDFVKITVPNIPLSLLSSGTATIEIANQSLVMTDRMVVAQYELSYPRIFNFGAAKNFEFSLPANTAGNYLEISNFNYGTIAPILYDVTNKKRYTGNISNPSLLKFALEPSVTPRQLILFSLDVTNVSSINNFSTRNFKNFSLTNNQGDYLIISHPTLFNGVGGVNPVEQYRAYRATIAGGGYNSKIYEIDELVDQFAFGIKKHPLSVRNFLRWARSNFSVTPKFVFLIGHGIVYDQYRLHETNPDVEKLNLIPTFGWPASDILLSSNPSTQIPITPIGRLSVINASELSIYITKVQQYETAQQTSSPFIQDKAWMKNIVHVVGANDPFLQVQLDTFLARHRRIIIDTLFGANVHTFSKTSTEAVQQIANQQLNMLFEEGISQLTYFGHSSATTLDFNLDNPNQYNNQGKYPIFIVMGCNAGDFFNFNPARFFTQETLSEKFVLANERGSIAFLASSHLGIVNYLDLYNTRTYTAESVTHYNKSFGEVIKESVIQVLNQTAPNDFFARFLTEQNTLQGDPAIKLNSHIKPDYVIEDQLVKVSPSFVSIAETGFTVNAKFLNMGKAINKEIAVEVKRQLPNGVVTTVFKDSIAGIRYIDSLTLFLPINPTTDKGLNKIIITIDANNAVDELYETNNSITKEVYIFEDEARPIWPVNFAIVNKQNEKLIVSTANPFSAQKQYRMEFDTTEFFNSPFKRTQTVNSIGGLIEFTPGILFVDSTVYYWRVAALDSQGSAVKWNTVSFVYLANSDVGFNQSHFFQQTKIVPQRMYLDSISRLWKFNPVINNLFIRNTMWPTGGTFDSDFSITVNGVMNIKSACLGKSLIFNVFDSTNFKPWKNVDANGSSLFLYGSASASCAPSRNYNFEFSYMNPASRKLMMDFMDTIPIGSYVVVRSFDYDYNNSFAATWKSDTAIYGANNSLYHKLKTAGFSQLDSIYKPRAWAMVYKKGSNGFVPQYQYTDGIYDRIILSANCTTPDSLGFMTSPIFGKAKQWRQLKWRGVADIIPGDAPTVDVIGITIGGIETTLLSNLNLTQQDQDISFINAAQYPFLRLRMRNIDSIHLTPYQLKYWRVNYVPVPEGAVAPNLLFQFKDTLEVGEPLDFKLAFKNISETSFDSLKVKMTVVDKNNVTNIIPLKRFKPLITNDTVHIKYAVPTVSFTGLNTLFVNVNPDNDQPEQALFNNFIFKNFYVKPDKTHPLMDVTFDGVHILHRDIVSAKPSIIIQLKDEAKWLVLNDTAGIRLRVQYPNGVIRPFYFRNNDTLKFIAAGNAPNSDNTARIEFRPNFLIDGDYELIVSGKDRSGNEAGTLDYKVGFQIINKAMISNMLNYPNPFTTATAFVFTLTGNEVPQNIKIQILTITGKIVREITKEELGFLHIGRNITEFKWDGTDQYGQKLANGVYLYRVVTNLNGKSLDQYKADGDVTDKYFNKGYGKMYLMR
ncbi:MAG: hypothetical protein EPO57_06040 [Chitinophagaceae bacterium]|nr:MAG: hypothetical protein EPO57_06040 [Chitinophagaceae bacterium]